MNRRKFLKDTTPVLFLLAGGGVIYGCDKPKIDDVKKSKLRFAVISDGHYGQVETDYDRFFREVVSQINAHHEQFPLDCCVVNGDIINDNPAFLKPAKVFLDTLKMPYFVTQGNHDMVSEEQWVTTWNMPLNHHVKLKGQAFLMATTSNQQGKYLCPNLSWMRDILDKYKKSAENVFIFIHITPVKWTNNGIDCPDFIELLKNYPNVRLVCNGHDHDQDDLKIKNSIPYLFDGHIGGSWGTNYRGFRIIDLMKDDTIATYMMNSSVRIKEHVLEPFHL
jgi:hypothetical protein